MIYAVYSWLADDSDHFGKIRLHFVGSSLNKFNFKKIAKDIDKINENDDNDDFKNNWKKYVDYFVIFIFKFEDDSNILVDMHVDSMVKDKKCIFMGGYDDFVNMMLLNKSKKITNPDTFSLIHDYGNFVW